MIHTPARSRLLAGGVAALACAATVGASLTATASPATAVPSAGSGATDFGLQAAAFGSQLRPGDLQTGSGRSGLVVVSCTTVAGIDRARGVSSDDLQGNGQVDGVKTRVWTTESGGTVTSHARSRVTTLALGNESGSLALSDMVVGTHTWHDGDGFHRRHTFNLGGLVAEAGGVALPGLPAPDEIEPGQQVEVPGLATLTFDERFGRADRSGADARSTGLVIDVVDGSTFDVAQASARIDKDVAGGILGGRAQSAFSRDGLLQTSNPVKKSVPCTGTNGEWRSESGEATQQPGIETAEATVGALGDQLKPREAVSRTRAHTSRVSLGDGSIVVSNIRSQANVVRDGGAYTRTAKGSDIGTLRVDGQEHALPDPGRSLRIPGIAVIIPEVVNRTARSITVVGLRVRLLDGSEVQSVVDIAKSFAVISPR